VIWKYATRRKFFLVSQSSHPHFGGGDTWHRTLIREAVNLSSDNASANASSHQRAKGSHASRPWRWVTGYAACGISGDPSPSEADLRLTREFFQFFA
jgi:hypothetical protein